jgi:hypothetical protein
MASYNTIGVTGNRFKGMTDQQIVQSSFLGSMSKEEAVAMATARRNIEAQKAGFTTLADWEAYSKSGGTGRGKISWKGGNLTGAEFSAVQGLEKDKLTQDYQKAYEEAKLANETRYQEILGGYDKLMGDSQSKYDSIIASQAGMGNAEKADLQHSYDVLGSRQQQGLVNSGLSSTTIRPAVMAQNTTAMQRALSLVNERLQGQNTNLQVGSLNSANNLTQNKFGVMERRTDDYPNETNYLELLKQYGNA